MRLFSVMFGLAILASAPAVCGQKAAITQEIDPRTTQAYSMLIQRQVKVQAKLEAMMHEYSSEWPAAKELQTELDALKLEMKKLRELDPNLIPKLTSGVGALILRKATLITEIKVMADEYESEWPEAKEKQRELELLNKQIEKILS